MSNPIGNGVTLDGFFMEDAQFTVNLSGSPTSADVGKAVTQDTTAANTYKLAGDGDPIHGRLEVVQARTQEGITVGTVSFQWSGQLPALNGLTSTAIPVVGSFLVGAGGGYVKAAAAAAGVPSVRVQEVIGADPSKTVVCMKL